MKLTVIRVTKISGIALLIYGCICFGFYIFQDKLIFQPDSLPNDYVFEFDQPYQEFFITAHDGILLNALLFKTNQPAKGLILYFHGNADNLQRWGQYAVDLTAQGYDVLMPEYRGYGKSTGTPGELDFYQDAATVLHWAQKHLVPSRLILYGRSLGSAVAANLAMTAHPELLILETPFDDLYGVVYPPIKPMLSFLPLHSTFSNSTFLKKVKCKKVIIHGTDDWVVPLSSALRLKALLTQEDVFVVIEAGSHKDLRSFEEYHKVLGKVLGD